MWFTTNHESQLKYLATQGVFFTTNSLRTLAVGVACYNVKIAVRLILYIVFNLLCEIYTDKKNKQIKIHTCLQYLLLLCLPQFVINMI